MSDDMIEWLEYEFMYRGAYGNAEYGSEADSEAGTCSCGLLISDCPNAQDHMSHGVQYGESYLV